VTDLSLSRDTLTSNDTLLVHVTVKNTGKRKGKYAIDLFVKDYTASITPPVKRLRRFKKLLLAPGESKTVVFTLKQFDFSYVGEDLKRHVDPGRMAVIVGGTQKEFYIKK
jgi:beta-glucosidase